MLMNNHHSFKNLAVNEIFRNITQPALFYDPWGFYSKEEIELFDGVYYGNLSL